jgi:hypothetical protein
VIAPQPPRRRRSAGMPADDQAVPVETEPTADPARLRGLLAFGLELLDRRQARHQRAAS